MVPTAQASIRELIKEMKVDLLSPILKYFEELLKYLLRNGLHECLENDPSRGIKQSKKVLARGWNDLIHQVLICTLVRWYFPFYFTFLTLI